MKPSLFRCPEQLAAAQSSQAQFHKVGEMEQQDKQKFNAEAFKKQLNDRIEAALPKDDNETVDRYEHPHKGKEAMTADRTGVAAYLAAN